MSAYIGAGLARGSRNVQQYAANKPIKEAQLQEAENRAQMSNMQLESMKQTQPSQTELQVANLKLETRRANAQLLNNTTFSAFDKFKSDGQARHLNYMLDSAKSNPLGRSMYSTIARYDNVSNSFEDKKLLEASGISDVDSVINDPELNKSFVIATKPDGSRVLYDMNQVYATTGYSKHLTQEELEMSQKKARVAQLLRTGQTSSAIQQTDRVIESMLADNPSLSYHEAYKRVKEDSRGARQSADSRAISTIAEERGIDYLEAAESYFAAKNSGRRETNEERFINEYISENPGSDRVEASTAYANRGQTSTQKESGDIDTIKDELDSINFLDSDMSEMSTTDKAKISRNISKIEDLRGVKFSSDEKRVIRDLKKLSALGNTAGEELTSDETGLMDNLLNNFKKYMVDEVGGKEATSAYESFRNIFRHAMAGSALTKQEIEAFTAAAGSLNQKLQPVLVQLNTQMKTIKSQLEGIRDTNDPYLAKYYVGEDIENIDEAIRQIDSRLQMVSEGTPKELTVEDINRKPLSEIFGDN